jgi:hypothetical protein
MDQVTKNMRAGRGWCFLNPAQIGELIVACQQACRDREQIVALVEKIRLCLADNHVTHDHDPCVEGLLDEIEALATPLS